MSSDDLSNYELAEGEDPAGLLNEEDLLLGSDDGKLTREIGFSEGWGRAGQILVNLVTIDDLR